MTGFRVQRADTDHVKVVIHKVKLSNLHKIGNILKKSGKDRGNYQQNWKKSELSHSQTLYPLME